MKAHLPAAKTALLTMLHVGPPRPELDIRWSRQIVRVFPNRRIFRRVQAKMPNRTGIIAVRNSGWTANGYMHEPLAEYKTKLERLGFTEVSQ